MEFLNNQRFETIELEANNDWLHVKLNRPKSKNALSNAMITELINLISLAESQQFLRGIFLSGKEGSFCSGADLKEFQSFFSSGKPKKNEIISSSLNLAKLLKSFYHFPKYVFLEIYIRSFFGVSSKGLKIKILSSSVTLDLILLNDIKPFKPEPLNNLIKKFSIKSSV